MNCLVASSEALLLHSIYKMPSPNVPPYIECYKNFLKVKKDMQLN